MRLPEVAERLRELAADLPCSELDRLAEEIRRRPILSKAPRTSTPMCPALASKIRAYARANQGLPQTEIAKVFAVNPGRVSEALRGKRK